MAIKICKACGKTFEGFGTSSYCSGPHYFICEVCGKEFESDPRNPNRCCSKECKSVLRKKTINSQIKVCELCGKQFTSTTNTQRYCKDNHYVDCEVCGKPILVPKGLESDPPRACSTECRIKLRELTCIDKYGVSIVSQNSEVKNKLHDAAVAALKSKEATCLSRYGVKNASMTSEVRKKISNTVRSKSWVHQTKQTMQSRYGVDYAMQNHDLYTKHVNSRTAVYASDGTKLDSSYELLFYEFLKRNNIDFEYQVPVKYIYNDKSHVTYIDFKVNDYYFEIKGAHLLEGCFDYKGVPISAKLDLYKKHHVILITDSICANMFQNSNGLKYLNKCSEPLIGVDIKLFDNPQFPYDPNKPSCFYDVKVDSQMSSVEAFNDETIKWRMILNRINYVGGFIGTKQILTALNVTRTCKQPSWFSQSFAKHIISIYCTSDTIVDPFAGWGTRYDAAIQLGKKYVGCDLNPKLVEWHNNVKHREIQLCDANNFYYDGPCSVFICPPYSDPTTGRCFEDYNFAEFDSSAKQLSQCDWLNIVIKNVPNASEYIMVCKIVDSGWEKYIVEEKVNRSHLGVNKEYILVVKPEDLRV